MSQEIIPIVVGFLLVVKLITGSLGAVISWRISKMSVTPSKIWYLYLGAFILLVVRAVERIFYVHVYTELAHTYGFGAVFGDLVLGASIYVLLTSATLMTYFQLKNKFPGIL